MMRLYVLFLSALLAKAALAAPGWQEMDQGSVLDFHLYRPAGLDGRKPRALAVVLHGCTQTARGYAERAGWDRVADAFGLIVLAPEFDNPTLRNCFNWFEEDRAFAPGAVIPSRRSLVQEIREATESVAAAEGVERVFFTGLSAGGAMAAVLLADSRDWDGVRAEGAGIVAGVAYGCADTIELPLVLGPLDDAYACMGNEGRWPWDFGRMWEEVLMPKLPEMAERLGDHGDRDLRVSIWHGTADSTVDYLNAVAAGRQWARALGLPEPAEAAGIAKDGRAHPDDAEQDYTYLRAQDDAGARKVEVFLLDGLRHAMPIRVPPAPEAAGPACGRLPERGSGDPDDHYEDTGICAAYWIARSILGEP